MSMSEFVASRPFGDAVVTVISAGTQRWNPHYAITDEERRRAMPEASDDGTLTIGLNFAHVRLGDASILIDPGCDDPSSAWAREFQAKWAVAFTPGLAAGLERIGVAPESVTHVLITHAHEDHYAGVTAERGGVLALRFPRARHFVGRRDWEEHPARHQPDSALVRRLGLTDRHGLLEMVDREREIVPGVTMISAPGETPGHCIVRVESLGRRFYYLGDLIDMLCVFDHLDWVSPRRDSQVLPASRRRVLAEAADCGATLTWTHDDFPAWGRAVRSGTGFRWERI